MKFRIRWLRRFGGDFDGSVNGYNVATRAVFTNLAGVPIVPDGSMYTDSGNYFVDHSFEKQYLGQQQWHSSRLQTLDAPFWGTVEFPSPQPVEFLRVQATNVHVANRSMQAFAVDRLSEINGDWIEILRRENEPVWGSEEVRVFDITPLVEVTGRAIVNQGPRPESVVLFSWDYPKTYVRRRLDASGAWAAQIPRRAFGVYYLSSKSQYKPTIHGPYEAPE